MILTKDRLQNALDAGMLEIKGFNPQAMKHASYSFTLSGEFFHQAKKTPIDVSGEYTLKPGEFILANTAEKLDLKGNYVCILSTRGAFAQRGIDCLQTSTMCEPDMNARITLEIVNHSSKSQTIKAGDTVIKGVFIAVD